MSNSRLQTMLQRTSSITGWLFWGLAVLTGMVQMTALAQLTELSAGVEVAKKMTGNTLAEGAVILSGICVVALVYVVRFTFTVHAEQMRSTIKSAEAITVLSGELRALHGEMSRRRCLLDMPKQPHQTHES